VTHLLMRNIVVNPCLKFLPNALGRDGGEVAVGKNGVYDGRVGRLLLWRYFAMLAEAGGITRKGYLRDMLTSAMETNRDSDRDRRG